MSVLHPPDPAALPPELQDQELGTEEFVMGSPNGERRLGLLIKRTYAVHPDGTCELAAEEDQEPIVDAEALYEEVEPPRRSSVQYGNDTFAFKDRTDVILQGSAFAHEPNTRTLEVHFRLGATAREIRVFGDRRGDWINGRPRFSDPEPIEDIPLRYEHAYGGFDAAAFRRQGWPEGAAFNRVRPEWNLLASTPFHYRRNPCGTGFLVEMSREAFDGLTLPNLEYPFDPLTPERIVAGSRERWMGLPLPACLDWQSAGWFPRSAYLGMATPSGPSTTPQEVQLGWEPEDLLQTPPILEDPERPVRQEYFQGAAPGMALTDVPPGSVVEIGGCHPDLEVFAARLPHEQPRVRLALNGRRMETLITQLNTVVVRPDRQELVLTWCAWTPVDRMYALSQLEAMRREIDWHGT